MRSLAVLFVATLSASVLARAGEIPPEFRIKRKGPFEFAKKPEVTRAGDRVTISFAAKAACDATIAIEDTRGRIVRHLASGVLGENAPPPFKKGTLEQTVVWDGKDDQGTYVDDKDACVVRVSLGLEPRFERSLLWTPHKRYAYTTPIVRACPQGVLVYEGQIYDSVRLFDHEGNYVRTVYPFPAAKLKSIPDLRWTAFPQDGARLPMKEWFRQATLLTSGDNSNREGEHAGAGWRGFGSQRWYHDGHGAGSSHHAASAMAVHGEKVALAMYWVNRLSLDGSTGGRELNGPTVCYPSKQGGLRYRGGDKIIRAAPHSAAFSPDGKWLYMTGYTWMANFGTGGRWRYWLPGVTRVAWDGKRDSKSEIFVGSMKRGDDGKGDRQFEVPTSLDCDDRGRVYVSDYVNNRVQVFTPDAKLFKTIRINRPAKVAVHRKTGEIYVFSWGVNNVNLRRTDKVKPLLTRLGPVEKPVKIDSCELPLPARGSGYAFELDSWAEKPTVWMYTGSRAVYSATGYRGHTGGKYWQSKSFEIYTLEKGKLVLKRDFGEEAAEKVLKSNRVGGTGRDVTVNHKTGDLYVGDGSATAGFSFSLGVRVKADTGKPSLVHLPFDAEQWAFDVNGWAYLRAKAKIVRYDPRTWREIPWDYGEEHKNVGVSVTEAKGPGKRTAPEVISALVTPYFAHAPNGVFSINSRGHLVVPMKGKAGVDKSGLLWREGELSIGDTKPYQFQLFPGRSISGLLMVFDRSGKLIYDDAVPGLTLTHGVKIDRDDNLYVMAMQNRMFGKKPYFNPATLTLMKFPPKKGRVIGTHKKAVPVPLKEGTRPERPPDLIGGGKSGLKSVWVSGAEWMYGGVGYTGEHHKNPAYGCDCCYSSFDLDYFARSFAPEVEHCSVAVLDSAGNLILRVGRYGNVDDGKPLVPAGGPARTNSIGGDEVAIFYAPHLAVHTDRRLFIADVGNERIVSVKLGYGATEKVALKDVPDAEKK
ncbi:MAG: NHL repeat-containing protein [Planctomycetota bacterium]